MRWSYDQPAGKALRPRRQVRLVLHPRRRPGPSASPPNSSTTSAPPCASSSATPSSPRSSTASPSPPGLHGIHIAGVPNGMAQRVKPPHPRRHRRPEPSSTCASKRSTEPPPSSPSPRSQENVPVKDSDFTFSPPKGVPAWTPCPPSNLWEIAVKPSRGSNLCCASINQLFTSNLENKAKLPQMCRLIEPAFREP